MRDFWKKTAWVKTGSPHQELYLQPFDTGDDANDGLTSGTPMKTYAALFDRHGHIIDNNVRLNVQNFSGGDDIIDVFVDEGHYLLINGGTGSGYGNFGSSYSVSVSDKSYIIVSPDPGWTTDQFAGVWCRISSGGKAGERRMVQYNTSDTVFFAKYFATNGGMIGFHHVIPNVSIGEKLSIRNRGPGELRLQNFNINTTGQLEILRGDGIVTLSGITRVNGTVDAWLITEKGALLEIQEDIRSDADPDAFETDWYGGVGSTESTSEIRLDLSPTAKLQFQGLVTVGSLEVWGGEASEFIFGGRAGAGMFLSQNKRGKDSLDSGGSINETIASIGHIDVGIQKYADFSISGLGLRLRHAVANMRRVDISDCSVSAIQLLNSQLMMHEEIIGTGSTGFGVYLRGGSTLLVGDTVTPPTLTGTVGDITFDDITEHADWTEIIAGDHVADAAKLNAVYEVSDSWYLTP
jgi:hypothetical protein